MRLRRAGTGSGTAELVIRESCHGPPSHSAGAIRTGHPLAPGPERPDPSRFSAVSAWFQHALLPSGHPRFPGTAPGNGLNKRRPCMSRSRKALAAAAMALAAAAGGLLAAAAGAVPAAAATQATPSAGHPGGHVVATITMGPASRIGPSVIQPCAVHRPGAAPAYGDGGGCDSGIITCDVTATAPEAYGLAGGNIIAFGAFTYCSEAVNQIRMSEDVIHSTPYDPNNPLTDSTVKNSTNVATTSNSAACQPGQYAVDASASIIPPDGDIVTGSWHDTSATVTFSASDCGISGGGGGGGGGCATATPSVSVHPAARHPDRIVCGG